MEVSAKSLILDLLSTARDSTMPVSALVAAGELFGFSGNNLRVALARLHSRGRVERDEPSCYRLTASAQAVRRHVGAWSQFEQRMVAWRSGWITLHTAGLQPVRRSRLQQRRQALDFFGFRSLAPDLWVRPDNLAGGVGDLRLRLYALGLQVDAPVFTVRDLDSETEARARGLWDVAALNKGYREGRDALLRSTERLRSMRPERALVETFKIGGRALHRLAFDPLLPELIMPAEPRQAFVDEMRSYDRGGRVHWRAFMKAHGVSSLDSPLRVRTIDLGEPQHGAVGGQL